MTASSIEFVAFVLNLGETWVSNYQAGPKTLYGYGHRRNSRKGVREVCAVHCGEV